MKQLFKLTDLIWALTQLFDTTMGVSYVFFWNVEYLRLTHQFRYE